MRQKSQRRLQPLLQGTTYSDTIGLIGAPNSIGLFPNLRMVPKGKLTMTVGSAFFWRESTRDVIHSINVAALRTGQLSRARFVGALPSARLAYPTSLVIHVDRFAFSDGTVSQRDSSGKEYELPHLVGDFQILNSLGDNVTFETMRVTL